MIGPLSIFKQAAVTVKLHSLCCSRHIYSFARINSEKLTWRSSQCRVSGSDDALVTTVYMSQEVVLSNQSQSVSRYLKQGFGEAWNLASSLSSKRMTMIPITIVVEESKTISHTCKTTPHTLVRAYPFQNYSLMCNSAITCILRRSWHTEL